MKFFWRLFLKNYFLSANHMSHPMRRMRAITDQSATTEKLPSPTRSTHTTTTAKDTPTESMPQSCRMSLQSPHHAYIILFWSPAIFLVANNIFLLNMFLFYFIFFVLLLQSLMLCLITTIWWWSIQIHAILLNISTRTLYLIINFS